MEQFLSGLFSHDFKCFLFVSASLVLCSLGSSFLLWCACLINSCIKQHMLVSGWSSGHALVYMVQFPGCAGCVRSNLALPLHTVLVLLVEQPCFLLSSMVGPLGSYSSSILSSLEDSCYFSHGFCQFINSTVCDFQVQKDGPFPVWTNYVNASNFCPGWVPSFSGTHWFYINV